MTSYDIMDALNYVDDEFLEPILAGTKPRRMKNSLRIAIAVAAALILLLTAAIASGTDGFLSELFGESYDIIGDYVMMEPVSAENEFARLTVESALSDGFNAYVIYSVERLDGGVMEGMSPDMEITPVYSAEFSKYGVQYSEPFVTGDETPQKRWYMFYRSGDTGMTGVELRLFGVQNWDTYEKADFGELRLDISFKQSPLKLGGPGGDPMGNEIYTKIILSPLGLRMRARTNLTPLTTDGSGERVQADYLSDVGCTAVLLYKDGRRQDVTERLVRRFASVRYDIIASFGEPVDIEQVEAIEINGLCYELDYGELEENELQWQAGDGYLALQREYVYGSHLPVYPQISTEGSDFRIDMESIWTDGSKVEMFLYMEDADGERNLLRTVAYDNNGLMEIIALDKKGGKLAVSAEFVMLGQLEDGRFLYGYIMYIGGEAETLTINVDGAEMNIPLNMKKLKKLPQGEPYTEPSIDTPEDKSDIYQTHYEDLFGYRTPEKVGISADNGEYRITIEYLWQMVFAGEGKLKAMVRCERMDGGEYDDSFVPGRRETEIGVVWHGEYRAATSVDGGFALSWTEDNLRYAAADIDYEFRGGARDTVRLTWTPPSGARITLDVPVE